MAGKGHFGKRLLFIFVFAILAFLHLQISRSTVDKTSLVEFSPKVVFSSLTSQQLNLITLGFRPIYLDFAVIWQSQYLANPNFFNRFDGDFLFKELFSTIQQHPRHLLFYQLACFSLWQNYAKPNLCEPIIQEGLKTFHNNWNLAMTQGFIYGFVLKEPIRAALYYKMAAKNESSPPYVLKLAQRLINSSGIESEETTKYVKEFENLFGIKLHLN
ncbi:MAG: hypothetical protein KBD78_06190 [Oligoflexales bacterium]|nr:hypothetical protein [Oligoflexales bacterium]